MYVLLGVSFWRLDLELYSSKEQDISFVEEFDLFVSKWPDVEPLVGPTSHSAVSILPSELRNVFVSELGLELDVLEVEVEVPFGVSDLEVVASSGQRSDSSLLILVFPAGELKPFFGGLGAEQNNDFVIITFLPSIVEDTSSGVAFQVTSRGIAMLANSLRGESLAVFFVFELPIGVS